MNKLSAKETFLEFMKCMNIWEINTYNMQNTEDKQEESKKILTEIFKKFCTPKDRKHGKPNFFSAGPISNYDINTQPIYNIEEVGKKSFIYTKLTNKGLWNLKYTLLQKNGVWLLDKKEISFDNGKSWKKENL